MKGQTRKVANLDDLQQASPKSSRRKEGPPSSGSPRQENEGLLSVSAKEEADRKQRARRFAELEKDNEDPVYYPICVICCHIKRKNAERLTLGLAICLSLLSILCLIQVALIFQTNERPIRIVIQPILFNGIPFIHFSIFLFRLCCVEIYSNKKKKIPKCSSTPVLAAFLSQNIFLLVLVILGGFSPIKSSEVWMLATGICLTPINLYCASVWNMAHTNNYQLETVWSNCKRNKWQNNQSGFFQSFILTFCPRCSLCFLSFQMQSWLSSQSAHLLFLSFGVSQWKCISFIKSSFFFL